MPSPSFFRTTHELLTDRAELKLYSSLLTDPTTWYWHATAVVEQAMTTSDPAFKLYEVSDDKFIDLYHHRIQSEELIDEPRPRINYKVKVEVDSGSGYEEITECHDIYDPVGDALDPSLIPSDEVFVKYNEGEVIFGSSQENNNVRISYYKPNRFGFIIHPPEGKCWEVREASTLGSAALKYTCAAVFGIEVNVGSAETPIWMPYSSVIYGNMWCYLQETQRVQPMVPAGLGGPYIYGQQCRGLKEAGHKMHFPYLESQKLSHLQSRINIYFIEGDGPWIGDHGSAAVIIFEEDA